MIQTELATPPDKPNRLVFMGTPDLAVPTLHALHRAGFELPLVISQPDRRRGRGKNLHPSPVKSAALELGLRVSDVVEDCLDVEADLAVVVAFGRLIKRSVLEAVPMVNLHFSLLPRWRGAAPVERALLAGDTTTGVCLMQLVEELDAGGIYRQAEVEIAPDATLDTLRGSLVEIGTAMLVEALRSGLGQPTPQVGEAVYARKIDRNELRLDPGQAAAELDRVIRLGGAWLEFRGKRLRLWKAEMTDQIDEAGPWPEPGSVVDGVLATASGGLRLIEVQPEGKARMAAADWLNGAQIDEAERLG